MKQTKVIIAATIATIIIMLSCAYAIPATAEACDREEKDEIIEVYWEGYTENPVGFFSLEGWR